MLIEKFIELWGFPVACLLALGALVLLTFTLWALGLMVKLSNYAYRCYHAEYVRPHIWSRGERGTLDRTLRDLKADFKKRVDDVVSEVGRLQALVKAGEKPPTVDLLGINKLLEQQIIPLFVFEYPEVKTPEGEAPKIGSLVFEGMSLENVVTVISPRCENVASEVKAKDLQRGDQISYGEQLPELYYRVTEVSVTGAGDVNRVTAKRI